MHPGYEKDYRYLLSKLIPRQLLSSQRIDGLLRALDSNDRLEMIREAYFSLEELAGRGIFRKERIGRTGRSVSVTYIKTGEPARITLKMSQWEWEAISGRELTAGGIVPSVLAGIISSLSLNNSPKTLLAKMIEVLELVNHIHRGATGYLVLLQEEQIPEDKGGSRIRALSLSELSRNELYRSCMTGELQHAFLPVQEIYERGSLFEFLPGTRSIVLIPLLSEENKLGLFEIHLKDEQPPGRDTFSNFYILGQGIVRLMENNRHLENMVSIDRLTQVNNRNYYDTQLPLEIERANRDRKSLGFLIMDIDDFKEFNDRYGHDVGDLVLKSVAHNVRTHLRKIDLLFRYGGEEFIALLPGADREAAERTAERIRDVISQTNLYTKDKRELKVTISVGGCVYPEDAQNETELFRRADQALYRAKSSGKDTVQFYTP
jgi:diguanylate cyclase (GGDEF)-like protein